MRGLAIFVAIVGVLLGLGGVGLWIAAEFHPEKPLHGQLGDAAIILFVAMAGAFVLASEIDDDEGENP